MSNYSAPALNPLTWEVECADWIDNHFGRYAYGVRFRDGNIYTPDKVGVEAAAAELSRLRAEVEAEKKRAAEYWEMWEQNAAATVAAVNRALSAESALKGAREALEPFAKMFDKIEADRAKFGPDHWPEDRTEFSILCARFGEGYFKFGDLRRAAALRSEPQGGCGAWRTMEIAPQDGSDVLLWWPYFKLDDEDNLTDEQDGGQIVIGNFAGGWQEAGGLEGQGAWFGDHSAPGHEPSHWQPLPSPPCEGNTSGEGRRG